jgi:hypothetical protein
VCWQSRLANVVSGDNSDMANPHAPLIDVSRLRARQMDVAAWWDRAPQWLRSALADRAATPVGERESYLVVLGFAMIGIGLMASPGIFLGLALVSASVAVWRKESFARGAAMVAIFALAAGLVLGLLTFGLAALGVSLGF